MPRSARLGQHAAHIRQNQQTQPRKSPLYWMVAVRKGAESPILGDYNAVYNYITQIKFCQAFL